MNILQIYFLTFFLFLTGSCKRQSKVNLQLDVRDDVGNIVNDAYVELNDRKIGRTDINGELNVNLPLKRGEHRLKIMKETEEIAYEPFEKTIFFFKKNEKTITIHAIVRSNLKPFPEDNSFDDFPELPKKQGENSQEVLASVDMNTENEIQESTESIETKEPVQVEEKPLPETSLTKFGSNIEKLLSEKKYKQAIEGLKNVKVQDPEYIASWQKIGDIYLKDLKEYKRALASYDKLTRLPALKNYENPKFIEIYMNKALAYYNLGEIFATKDRKESTRFFKNTYWITNRISNIANTEENLKEFAENTAYYRALSLHRIWQNNPKLTPSSKVSKEWERYQSIAKNLKNSDHPKYFVNSEKYLKQIKL